MTRGLLAGELPLLPLVLWKVPPGLELLLRQEGVPFLVPRDGRELSVGGRFVLHDSRVESARRARTRLGAEQRLIDIDALRHGEPIDPLRALLDTRARRMRWEVGGIVVVERVARADRRAIRERLLGRLRRLIRGAGGVWARLAAYPYPYRSAFNLRVDLDEPYPDDYWRFASARGALEDCTTHFVSTAAYGAYPDVLADLRGRDAQSHGHYHTVYRDETANRRNLERAHAALAQAGITATAFAGPEGRWNAGLDRTLEALGYTYASEFQVGYDDLPFQAWRDGRFSPITQVPVHPVSEGLFLDAGVRDPGVIADHLAGVVDERIAAGLPAFVYGHPERRLGRMPEVLERLGRVLEGRSLVWRVTLTEFARWWRWRQERRWMLLERGPGRYEAQFEEWDPRYPLALELVRGEHVAKLRVPGSRVVVDAAELAFERGKWRLDSPPPRPAAPRLGLRQALRGLLDWETVTPVADLPASSWRDRVKRGLRRWKSGVPPS